MNIKHYILLPISALMLASCGGDEAANNAPSADDRLPLRFETSLSTERPLTRAYDGTIEAKDELLCYVRHVDDTDVRKSVQASLVKIVDNKPTTALYWDDFSNSNSKSTDLRTSKHGLQSYYGYCYNGGAPVKDSFKEVDGELQWETEADQSKDGIKKYDLLWSSEQEPVTYNHAKGEHGTISVPYTHAMSKFTVVVVAGEGFEATDLETATVTLHGMNLKGTFTAPTAQVVAEGTTEVQMYGHPKTDTQRAFEAVVVPKTSIETGKELATITMAGNTYEVNITTKVHGEWEEAEASQSGVNYKLTVTLNKQAIAVHATLADWESVEAEGDGEIQFKDDITEKGENKNIVDGYQFRLWMAKEGEAFATEAATTATYDATTKAWNYSKTIYWPNGSDKYCFRALSGNTGFKVNQGEDVLWGTSGDAAIAPRTGTVPLTFSHVMSQVKVVLKTSDDEDKAVELEGATVTMTQITTDGSIAIADGTITLGDNTTTIKLSDETIMVPQTIAADAKIIITLKDETSYSLTLNQCLNEEDGNDPITEWKRGESYTYTIYLEKEDVKFRAVIEPWKEQKGSGNATLDWD